jgi:hypothetical protein
MVATAAAEKSVRWSTRWAIFHQGGKKLFYMTGRKMKKKGKPTIREKKEKEREKPLSYHQQPCE